MGKPGVVEPSIYAADFARLGEQLESLLDAGARVFHFDIGDGHFIGEITIGPVVLRSIAGLVHERDGVLDCHLMVSQPERHFESVRAAGGDSVTFHVEAVDDPAGRPRTRVSWASASASPSTPGRRSSGGRRRRGRHGHGPLHEHPPRPFRTGLHARSVRPHHETALPGDDTVFVQVDGGVSAENAAGIREAGADLLVAGSAIFWQDEPAAAYVDLTAKVAETVG